MEHPALTEGDEAFARALYTSASDDPLLLTLLTRLSIEIEHNVSTDALVAHKREFARAMQSAAERLAPPLALTVGQVAELLTALGALLVGAVQIDMAPRLQSRQLPQDVHGFVQSFSSEAVFVSNAQRILAGIRTPASGNLPT